MILQGHYLFQYKLKSSLQYIIPICDILHCFKLEWSSSFPTEWIITKKVVSDICKTSFHICIYAISVFNWFSIIAMSLFQCFRPNYTSIVILEYPYQLLTYLLLLVEIS